MNRKIEKIQNPSLHEDLFGEAPFTLRFLEVKSIDPKDACIRSFDIEKINTSTIESVSQAYYTQDPLSSAENGKRTYTICTVLISSSGRQHVLPGLSVSEFKNYIRAKTRDDKNPGMVDISAKQVNLCNKQPETCISNSRSYRLPSPGPGQSAPHV